MKKGIFIITTLLLLMGFYWLFYYQAYFRTPLSNVQAIEAVPPQTALVLEFDNYFQTRSVLAKMPYTKEFEHAFFVKKMSEDLKPIRKVFSKTKDHRRLLLYSSMMAALQISQSDDADFLYILKDEKNVFKIEEVLKHYSYKKFEFNGSTVYELSFNNQPMITVGYYQGIILLSKYAFLVENGMRQLKDFPSTLITDNRYTVFSEKLNIEEKHNNKASKVNVYMLFENFPVFAHPFTNESFQYRMKVFSSLISSAKLELNFKKKGIEVNGLFNRTEESYVLERFFAKEKEEKSSIKKVVPDDVAYFVRADLPSERTMKLKSPNDNEVYKKYFQPWMHEEWALGCAKIFTRRIQSEQFVMYKMENAKKAKYHLGKLAEEFGELKSTSYLTYPIYQILTRDLPIPILGNEFSYIKNPHYTFIEDYVIFSASQASLENWIDKYLTSQTLNNHVSFLELEEQIGKEGNISSFCNTTGTLPLIQSFIKKSITGNIRNQLERLGKMQPIGFQFDVGEEIISTKGFFNYQEKVEEEAIANLWKRQFDKRIISNPSVHYDEKSDDHQILIQDQSFKLYALNSSGEKLWDLLLEDTLASDIISKDIFKNGEQHFVFNTKKDIYVIDYQGNTVQSFPLSLPTRATNGLSIVDFGEKDFALFVACENENIYGYDTKGIPIVGWNPVEHVGRITQPLQHFQYQQKDFLSIINDDGNLITLGKNGNKIMEGMNVSGHSDASLFFHLNNSNQMVVADQTGSIHSIHVDDKNIQLNLKADVMDPFLFSATDMAGDDQLDIAKLKGRNLEIFHSMDKEFQLKGKHQFAQIQQDIFSVGLDEQNKAMIGTLNKYQNQIFLLDKIGNVHPAFPLRGTTRFQLVRDFNNNKNAIIVGNQNELIVYEID